MRHRSQVTIVLARFEDIVERGLTALIDDDENLRLLASGIGYEALTDTLEQLKPDVAILNFGSLGSTLELRDLHNSFPNVRLLVLANQPTPSESRQLLAFGATACLAKNIEARDVRHAIHLASRGLHVLPATAIGAAPSGPELLTPREAEVLELLQGGRSNAEIAHVLHVG